MPPLRALACWQRYAPFSGSFITEYLSPSSSRLVRGAPRSRLTTNLPLHRLLLNDLMSHPIKSTPLVAPGHTRPVTHLSFSPIQEDGTYLLVSSCKDGNPMLREWTGDWIGTFLGHKGAVWSTKISLDGSRAASGSADFTAYVSSLSPLFNPLTLYLAKYGTRTLGTPFIHSRIITSSAP